jgi:Ca-activated chloride channel family protein
VTGWRDPAVLAALLLVPALVWALVRAERARRRALDQLVEAGLQEGLVVGVEPRRRRVRAALVVAAVAALVVALAGPRLGFSWEEVKREGVDLVIALDVSQSMRTADVQPSRLGRATLGIRDLLALAKGDRVALVLFAGTAFLQCPLTLDQHAFLESLAVAQPGIIPRGGTNLAAAIDTALEAFEGREGRNQALVLITDGEGTEGDVDAAVARARERGVRIFTVGIGTPEGELVPGEEGGYHRDRQGQVVKSRLDETTLEKIAQETGGAYLHAAGASLGLDRLYREHLATLERRDLGNALTRRAEERFQWPLALALLLLAVEWLVGDGRRLRAGGPTTTAVAALALVVAGTGFLDPDAAGRAGNQRYAEGQYDEAVRRYNEGLVDQPDSVPLHLNLGAAAYKAGDLAAARRALEAVPEDTGDPARTAARFHDLGNVQFRQGEALAASSPQEALKAWEAALGSYRRALQAQPDDADARWNHELVSQEMAALRKKMEQQQQQQQQGGQQKQDDQQQKQDQQQQQQQQEQQQGGSPQERQDQQAHQERGDRQGEPPPGGRTPEQQQAGGAPRHPDTPPTTQPQPAGGAQEPREPREASRRRPA